MYQIFHIIKYKLLSYIRLESKLTVGNVFKNIGSGFIYLLFIIGAYSLSQSLCRFLLVDIRLGLFLLHEFISMVLFIFFMSVILGNIIVAYSTLYKSNEVNFLLTKPILPSKIFFIKFLDNFFYSSSTLLMVLFSMLAGYVVYFKLGIIDFIIIICNFIPYMFSAGSIGVILLLILIRLANKFGISKVIAGLSLGYIFTIIFFFRNNSPRSLVSSILKYHPFINRDEYFSDFLPAFVKFLPNNWLSQSAYWLVRDNTAKSLSFLFIQVAVSLILFSIALFLGYKWYFKTWLLNLKLTSELISHRKDVKPVMNFEKKSIFKSQTESIIKRDIHLFLREPSQLIHFIVLFLLIVIFISSVSGIKFIGIGNYNLQTMIYLSIFLFNLFLISTLSLRFIFPLISLEGLSFWRLKSAPVNSKYFIRNKLVIFSSFILFVSIVLSYFSNYKFGLHLTLFSVAVSILAAPTIIAINFGMGGLFSNFKEKNAIRLSSSQGATLSFLLNILYMLFIIIILFKPVSELLLSKMIRVSYDLTYFVYALIPIGVISAVIFYTFIKLAYKSLQKDF